MTQPDTSVAPILRALGFATPVLVRGRASIADLFRRGHRCGIYVLHFDNGEFYVGLASDVTRRYCQHRANHQDIGWISFRLVPRKLLETEERRIIGELEAKGFPLRNISLVSVVLGDTDFDLVMPVDDQEKWLSDLGWEDVAGDRADDPDHRRRYSRHYERFLGMPSASEIIGVLSHYVHSGIPRVIQGEVTFWCASCLPRYATPNVTICSRINVGLQEVFTAAIDDAGAYYTFHLSRSPLESALGQGLRGMRGRHRRVSVDDHFYPCGGQDQCSLIAEDSRAAHKLLDDHDVLKAIRLFNIRQMRKGPCLNSRYHCYDLADRIIEKRR